MLEGTTPERSLLDDSHDRALNAHRALRTVIGDRVPRILVIEPDPFVMRRVDRALSTAGCVTVPAAGLPDAIQRFGSGERVNLLLMAVDAPGGDPRGELPDLPLLLLAGHGAGTDDAFGHPLVRKPFGTTELLEAVTRVLGRHPPAS
jgi:CheY-like chemotaxis protein